MHAPALSVDAHAHPLIRRDSLARAILAGFAASLTMLLLFLVAYNLARLLSVAPTPSWPVLERQSIIHPAAFVTGGSQAVPVAGGAGGLETPRLWLLNLTHNHLIDAGLSDVYLAAGIYLLGGVLWAMLYTVVEPHLRGSPWQRGATFSLLPALVSLVVVLPLLGGGLFGLALGAGPLPIVGNVLLHLVYGAILGVVYGPVGDLDASTLERPGVSPGATTRGAFEGPAALLLIAGLVVGGVAGLAASSVAGGQGAEALSGLSHGGLILWGALLGAVTGFCVGSFLGLGERAGRQPAP